MKIKSFKESFSVDFYKKISENEFYESTDSNESIVDFTRSDDLNRLIDNQEILYYKRGTQRMNGFVTYRMESNELFCRIFEIDDDWFFVNLEYDSSENFYYKCDQFDGLIKLLSDKNII
jgi:hypothetical protein